MVDLHTHILPKMDDGSGAVGTSLAMLRREAEQGVDAVCATSHYYAHHEGSTRSAPGGRRPWSA